jgi:predicted DNA-binding transcriptional regulator
MGLIDIYFEHAMIVYSLLPKSCVQSGNPRLRRFYALLPADEEFERKKANEMGAEIAISEKSVHNYIHELLKQGLLVNTSYGKFMKPAIQ